MYIPAIRKNKMYKIFLEDVAQVHTFLKKNRPSVPSYDSVSPLMKKEEVTDI